MKVGDLVERSWPPDPGRLGMVVALSVPHFTRTDDEDFFVVQWIDGVRDTIRSQFLRIVNEGR